MCVRQRFPGSGRGRNAVVAGTVLVMVAASSASGQRLDDMRAGVARAPSLVDSARADRPTPLTGVANPPLPDPSSHPRWYAPLASAVVPGSGQFLLGNDRFIAYASVELLAWWKYFKDSHDQAIQEAAFKDIARRVARSHFSTTLPDGPWSYYEAMRDFLESGRYSLSDASVIPENDTTTFNGQKWLLELRTHPDSASALAQYERDAIKPDFQWSWRNAQLQFDLYSRATNLRNEAYLAGVHDLTIIGLNHLLSMVDAFATVRLRLRNEADGRTSVGASIPW